MGIGVLEVPQGCEGTTRRYVEGDVSDGMTGPTAGTSQIKSEPDTAEVQGTLVGSWSSSSKNRGLGGGSSCRGGNEHSTYTQSLLTPWSTRAN